MLVEKRRTAVRAASDPKLAKRGNVAANFERHANEVVSLQVQIDAIMRAIADEEDLQPSFWETKAAIT